MRFRMRFFFLAVFVAASTSLFADEQKIRAFEQFVEEAMKAQKMPGLSVAILHGDFRWSRGFGLADVENEVPARADSSYRMASVTKPMTAVAVLRLVEEGKIDLDAEVQTYVPYFPKKSKPVTVRQLLAHQGGISHYRDYAKEGRIREPKNTREAIAVFEDFDLISEPGTAYNYSTYGFNLLGAVIEGASGKPYAEYLTENVWKPLGMTATRMDDPRALIPHRVTGYVLENGTLQRSEYTDISSRFAGGGTRSTVDDMVRFVEGLAAGKVLKAETRNAAWSAQPTRDGRYTNYGLGFGLENRNGRWLVGHSGAQQETRTDLVIAPSERFAYALASNFENADLGAFEHAIFEIFLGDSRPVGARADDDATQAAWRAMNEAFTNGLGYYDRHGKAMTTDARKLGDAFAYFNRARADGKLAADGSHPLSGEPLTILGSHMAAVLAAKGDLDVYHREGPLRFFADYVASNPRRKLDRKFSRDVRMWLTEWNRVWTPELQKTDFSSEAGLAVLERNREALEAATLKPDFSRSLVGLAERAAQRGDPTAAMRIANLAYALYPRSAAVNGVLGVFSLMTGDAARAKSLLATSLAIDPRDYARPENLLNIASFLSRGPTKPAAIALLELALELHPKEEKLRARLEELRK
jgi:CubicO group peptidase (beta-lactamase class C family)